MVNKMIKQTLKDIGMNQAVQYCLDHPAISVHQVAMQFDVESSKLQTEYRKEWYRRQKDDTND